MRRPSPAQPAGPAGQGAKCLRFRCGSLCPRPRNGARLEAGAAIGGALSAALAAGDYPSREAALAAAVEELASRHNALGITRSLEPGVRPFRSRPYRVLGCGRFVEACLETVADPHLRSLPLTGAIDQWADSTDLLAHPAAFRQAGGFYERWAAEGG